MSDLTIREPLAEDAAQLAELLCRDEILRQDLGFQKQEAGPTAEEFLAKLREWCQSHHATTFAIIIENAAIGTISLSHRSRDGQTAQVGYWIGSAYRRRGFGRRAFELVLDCALLEKIKIVSAKVNSTNHASRRLWESHGATFTPDDSGKLRYELRVRAR